MEAEIRQLLSQYEVSSDEVPVVYGSAVQALEGNEYWVTQIMELACKCVLHLRTPFITFVE